MPDKTRFNATVVIKHVSMYPNPIAFCKGDCLSLGAEDTEYPGWIRATMPDGNEGWAPKVYVDVVEGGKQGIATTDYCARELSVNVGEQLCVGHTLNGWHQAINQAGASGWVPAECVRLDQ